MTQQDFIFSNQRRHWLARHIAFWIIWWQVYFIMFHLPLHAVFGWNLNEANEGLQEFRVLWILKMMFFNSLLAVILPQMLFTYTLLYYILPRFLYKQINPLKVSIVLLALIVCYFFVAGCFKVLGQLPNYWMGLTKTFPLPKTLSFLTALRDTLTVLPIVAGGAMLLKLVKRWWLKEKETEQVAEEKIKAELQLLKTQVHPHFLFNTLNNIYFFTLSGSSKASEMIRILKEMLHYILDECNQPLVPLEKEIKMIKHYISLEKIRYTDQMDLNVKLPEIIDDTAQGQLMIAPLLLIPFVENSFKHGASKMLANPKVSLHMEVKSNVLHFCMTNSCPPETKDLQTKGVVGNLGLKNVIKRLSLLYPGAHTLKIIREAVSFNVYLHIELDGLKKPESKQKQIKTEISDAIA